MEVSRREKGKVTKLSRQQIVMFPPVLQIQIPDIENKSLEGDPMRLQLPGPGMTTSLPDGTKDAKAISLIVPLLPIVNSDSHLGNKIDKYEDLNGTQELLPVPQILAQEDRRIDLIKEDVMCVDDRVVTPYHQNGYPPSQTPPPAIPDRKLEPVLPQRVRDTFMPWQGYDGFSQCGRLDCIASLHQRYDDESRPRETAPSTSTAPAGPSNLRWGSSQGERTSPNPPRPRNN